MGERSPDSHGAVSYTHLDVYKRQVQVRHTRVTTRMASAPNRKVDVNPWVGADRDIGDESVRAEVPAEPISGLVLSLIHI